MKKIIFLFSIILIAQLSVAASIVEADDLLSYNPQQQISLMESEVEFWQDKLVSDPGNHMYLMKLAGIHDALFKIKGQISDLKQAEQYIRKSVTANHIARAGGYRSLAQNLISQHRFCEALDYAMEAEYIGGDLRKTHMVLFDISMEMGNDHDASWYLNLISNRQDFDFLIRKAKWEDKIGNLEGAIDNLEMAMALAEDSNDLNRRSWIYSNIADFYGHNGEIKKSKSFYEKALKINQADWYSVKKMAWIAWSNDMDDELALTMLRDLKLFNESPSIDLLISDILSYQNKTPASQKIKESISEIVCTSEYGYMYQSFLMEQCLAKGDFAKAKNLAEDEINRRPSVDSYVLLLKYYSAKGDLAAAKNIAYTYILGHTYEPAILLDVQSVLDPKSPEKQEIVDELVDCRFELGPLHYKELVKLVS